MGITTILPLPSLTPELKALLRECTDSRLQEILRNNIATRFAVSSSALADFRLAIANKDAKHDETILDDFRRLVLPTTYESYRPLINKFVERPCKLSEVKDLLAPGLPDFLCDSSSTSGKDPKIFPRYGPSLRDSSITNLCSGSGKIVNVWSLRTGALIDVATEPGEVGHTITFCGAPSGTWRTTMNWTVQTDDTRMTSIGTYTAFKLIVTHK